MPTVEAISPIFVDRVQPINKTLRRNSEGFCRAQKLFIIQHCSLFPVTSAVAVPCRFYVSPVIMAMNSSTFTGTQNNSLSSLTGRQNDSLSQPLVCGPLVMCLVGHSQDYNIY